MLLYVIAQRRDAGNNKSSDVLSKGTNCYGGLSLGRTMA